MAGVDVCVLTGLLVFLCLCLPFFCSITVYIFLNSQMLLYGCTRLEIGVQSVYEDIARDTNRGHTVKAVCESFQLSKDSGFKVVAHMMPDLPNSCIERDVNGFMVCIVLGSLINIIMFVTLQELFENPSFRPDGLKIYPTLVIRGTGELSVT